MVQNNYSVCIEFGEQMRSKPRGSFPWSYIVILYYRIFLSDAPLQFTSANITIFIRWWLIGQRACPCWSCSSDLPVAKVRPRDAAAPRLNSLAACTRANHLPAFRPGLPVPARTSAVASRQRGSCVTDVEALRRNRSADTDDLVVRAARCVSSGDRAFPVAAARTWNTLPRCLPAISKVRYPKYLPLLKSCFPYAILPCLR